MMRRSDDEKSIKGQIGSFSSLNLNGYCGMKKLIDVVRFQLPSIQGIYNVYKNCGDYDVLPKAFS